jgi:hypothetical protein
VDDPHVDIVLEDLLSSPGHASYFALRALPTIRAFPPLGSVFLPVDIPFEANRTSEHYVARTTTLLHTVCDVERDVHAAVRDVETTLVSLEPEALRDYERLFAEDGRQEAWENRLEQLAATRNTSTTSTFHMEAHMLHADEVPMTLRQFLLEQMVEEVEKRLAAAEEVLMVRASRVRELQQMLAGIRRAHDPRIILQERTMVMQRLLDLGLLSGPANEKLRLSWLLRISVLDQLISELYVQTEK